MAGMTKGERQELGQLIRKREKVMKAHAAERSAALLAEFDAQSAKIHSYDDDEVWKKAVEEAEQAVLAAQVAIAQRCKRLGIPEEFAPTIDMSWQGRGHNAVSSRRAELRRAAQSKISAIEAKAISEIEKMSLTAQTEVIASGLQSEAAKDFLGSMPSLEKLMPPVQFDEIQSLIEARRAQERQLGWH